MPRLAGKIALVTGAARGIGRGIAAAFVAEGATVVLSDVRHREGRAAAAALGAGARYLPLDVRDEGAWAGAMADVLAAHGRLDVLVNNAGITGFEGEPDGGDADTGEADAGAPGSPGAAPAPPAHDPEHATLADWRAVFATNLDGVFLGCRHALATMRRVRPLGAGGSIVNVASRSGLVGIPRAAAYAASKAAVRNHTKSVALYAAEEGLPVRCNSIHPAAVLTPMWDAMLGTGPERAARMEEAVRDTPLRRFGTVEEVAALAVYLAGDESAYTTGAEFVLDGGLLAGSAATPAPPAERSGG